jgi:transcriptional regulator with XRE-family HTH domain
MKNFCMASSADKVDNSPLGKLSKNLRTARRRLKLTQEQVAERSGVHAGEVSRIERGKRDPQVSALEKLAAAVEVPPGRLLD